MPAGRRHRGDVAAVDAMLDYVEDDRGVECRNGVRHRWFFQELAQTVLPGVRCGIHMDPAPHHRQANALNSTSMCIPGKAKAGTAIAVQIGR